MAIYRPFWGKRIANLTGLKFQELKDRQSLRFCEESDILCNNRSVIARHRSVESTTLGHSSLSLTPLGEHPSLGRHGAPHRPHDLAAIEALAASGLWERAGLVEARRIQELLKKQQNIDALTALVHDHPQVAPSQELASDLLQLTEIKRELIGDILTLFDDGLPREQTLALLGQVSVLIELVKRGQAQRVSP
ncbi:MAG: hypothetical protein JNL29_18025 [Nitrospira sp.]|jgi:hypothetical protein|nr:hypothetical protein [Nitrospira sp.]